MEHGVEVEIGRLRQRAARRRRVAQTLSSAGDATIALEEARLAEAEADRLEAELRAPPPVFIT